MPPKRRYNRALNCYMATNVIDIVERLALNENTSLSEVVRDLVDEGLRARGWPKVTIAKRILHGKVPIVSKGRARYLRSNYRKKFDGHDSESSISTLE